MTKAFEEEINTSSTDNDMRRIKNRINRKQKEKRNKLNNAYMIPKNNSAANSD